MTTQEVSSHAGTALPQYQSHKIVHGGEILDIDEDMKGQVRLHFYGDQEPIIVSPEYMAKHQPKVGGYYVLYKDGYESWSPAQAFKDGYRARITGYRQLSDVEIALMNRIKEFGPKLQGVIDDLFANGADPRWVAIGKTHLQEGLMALNRSVSKPESF